MTSERALCYASRISRVKHGFTSSTSITAITSITSVASITSTRARRRRNAAGRQPVVSRKGANVAKTRARQVERRAESVRLDTGDIR